LDLLNDANARISQVALATRHNAPTVGKQVPAQFPVYPTPEKDLANLSPADHKTSAKSESDAVDGSEFLI
jgi:hypothetical protein